MIRIAVAGAGRMGRAIVRLARSSGDFAATSIWVRDVAATDLESGDGMLVSDNLREVVAAADVLIDFSLPEATLEVLDAATQQSRPLVCGVSGLDDTLISAISAAAATIPLLCDRNMSQGIAVLDRVIRNVASSLGSEFAVEIHETHHIHKKDAPSGTALKLGEAVSDARGPESAKKIHYESLREGEVPGDHSVILVSPGERLEFSHSVTSRDVFAEGALRAASWLPGRKPGKYSMQDVLFGD